MTLSLCFKMGALKRAEGSPKKDCLVCIIKNNKSAGEGHASTSVPWDDARWRAAIAPPISVAGSSEAIC